MSDFWFGLMIGFALGLFFVCITTDISEFDVNAEEVATQICQFLDTDLIDYEMDGTKFEYIKCGNKRLIEGLDAEKLIEVL